MSHDVKERADYAQKFATDTLEPKKTATAPAVDVVPEETDIALLEASILQLMDDFESLKTLSNPRTRKYVFQGIHDEIKLMAVRSGRLAIKR